MIADIDSVTNPAAMAERLCQAIAGLPMQITASIGTASAPAETGPAIATMYRARVDMTSNSPS